MAKKLATVMIRTSRLATCESSWASTPSISCGSRRSQRPRVTATAACFGLRPVAKAFGTSVSTIATFGFGRSAIAQRRSTMSWSSGAWSRSNTLAPDAGKSLFTAQGCNGCHTFRPAGSKATIGPDLDNLASYAQKAQRGSLAQFVAESIMRPQAYLEPGYGPLMPSTYASLPKQQIADLVAFLTKK